MKTIEVETVEKWTIKWVEGRCYVDSGLGYWIFLHESDVKKSTLDKWPVAKEAALRCIIANRPLEEDECRDSVGCIGKFRLKDGLWSWVNDISWHNVSKCPFSRIREAHDRKFPRRKTLEDLWIDVDDAIDTYGGGSDERVNAMGALLEEIESRKWRPISGFVEDGREWEFYGEGVYSLKSPYNEQTTHFRKIVRPEDE